MIILLCFKTGSSTFFAQVNDVHFENVAIASGFDFTYSFGDRTYDNILESSGSGITILDYNGDGRMDIYMLNGAYLPGISDPEGRVFENAMNRLFRNNGDGTFTEVGNIAGVNDRSWSMTAGAADYDKDGDTDLFLLNYGPNIFYRNNGDGTFSDITDALGLRGPDLLNGFVKWSVSVAFLDIDSNSATDILVGNFLAFDPDHISSSGPDVMPHPAEYKGQPTLLYEQQENGGFQEKTSEYGLYYPDSKCMGLTVFDYDGDGDQDIFQGNDHQLNYLFRNEGNGKYQEVGIISGIAANDQGLPTGSMHGTIGDVDGDGLIDLLVTDLKHGALYRNLGNGLYEDITERSGIAKAMRGKGGWGAALFDFDNDGDLDLFCATGTAEELILQSPLLLENIGNAKFRDAGSRSGGYFSQKRSGRGAAVLDYDDDGDLDIVVSHVDLQADAVLLENKGGNSMHWLGLDLVGRFGTVDALGARVTAIAGDKRVVRINQPATSYLSWNDPRIHLGLGRSTSVDILEILWTDGTKEIFRDVPADRYIVIEQGKGILK